MEKFKEFFASSWAINNRVSIYVATVILVILGVNSYNTLPKESFPEIVVPTYYISTVYPGTAPSNIENLVCKPIEKQLKSVSGIKKITSNSLQDFGNVIVEFNTDVNTFDAKQKVIDAVDKAKNDLPKDLPRDPAVMEINFSEIPIMQVNVAGPYDLVALKDIAEDIKDNLETLKEVTRIDLVGAPEREMQVNVDMYKMQANQLTLGDVERALAFENMTITGGTVEMNGQDVTIGVKKEYKSVEEIERTIINSQAGASVPLMAIATVKDTIKKMESYARLNGENVITLNVIKRSGENLVDASDKTQEILETLKKDKTIPQDVTVVITGDQADKTRVTLHDLINTIIIGFILVTVLLMFFMGVTNALFVGLSVPLSMCLAFLLMPSIGFTLNMIVLFAFLLALGIVVDDAIVVVENTHRIFNNGKVSIVTAAKMAAGEVFLPVFSGTLTTLAPFIPLAFWNGLIGKFMFFLPITLIITLTASLLVAYIINPVFATDFMKPHDHNKKRFTKGTMTTLILFVVSSLFFHLIGSALLGNLSLFVMVFYLIITQLMPPVLDRFQNKFWPRVQNGYAKLLSKFLNRPGWTIAGTFGLFFVAIFLMMVRAPKVVFFPKSDPNFIYTYVNLPVGTSPSYTDSITRIVEQRVTKVVGKNNPIVTSIISNVTIGVTDPADGPGPAAPNKGKVSVAFVEFGKRNGEHTAPYLDKIREAVKGIQGAEIICDQERAGPPTAKPINIELTGDSFEELADVSKRLKYYLEELDIPGVEELKSDLESGKPEIVFNIDRERAAKEGISSAQIGGELRNAVFGKEVTKYRTDNDEYPLMVRYAEDQRENVEMLRNLRITYRDMNMGGRIRNVPISSFCDKIDTTSIGAIKRKNLKRMVTLSSNVLGEYNANEVVAAVKKAVNDFDKPDTVMVNMTGEQEEQAETAGFLGGAMLTSLGLIFLILVTQFNSVGKPVIILTEIFFSVIGVLLGVSIFKMDMSIVMTGVGIVALAGIVVRNGILMVEFTDVLKGQGMGTREAIVEAGRTRMTPVLLTAISTILGLIPLAVGLNIDFETLLTEFNPHIYFGGDSVAFWGPLSWTMIFGLSFATFLTLVIVPVMYLSMSRMKAQAEVIFAHWKLPYMLIYVPFFFLLVKLAMRIMVANPPDWKSVKY